MPPTKKVEKRGRKKKVIAIKPPRKKIIISIENYNDKFFRLFSFNFTLMQYISIKILFYFYSNLTEFIPKEIDAFFLSAKLKPEVIFSNTRNPVQCILFYPFGMSKHPTIVVEFAKEIHNKSDILFYEFFHHLVHLGTTNEFKHMDIIDGGFHFYSLFLYNETLLTEAKENIKNYFLLFLDHAIGSKYFKNHYSLKGKFFPILKKTPFLNEIKMKKKIIKKKK